MLAFLRKLLRNHKLQSSASFSCSSLPQSFCHVVGCFVQDIEKNLMKQDEERDERRAKNNQPAVVAQGLEMNDASGVRRRGKMMLPAPQVTKPAILSATIESLFENALESAQSFYISGIPNLYYSPLLEAHQHDVI